MASVRFPCSYKEPRKELVPFPWDGTIPRGCLQLPVAAGPGLAWFIPQEEEAEQKEARIGGLQRHRLASEITDFLIVHATSNHASAMAAEST